MKKLTLILLALMLVLLSACNNDSAAGSKSKEIPEDNSDEKVVFKGYGVKAPSATTSWDEMPFLQELEDKVNIDIMWTNATTQTYQEQINLMFASNDLPDLFFSAWSLAPTDIVKYGQNGQLIPLEDLIEKHAPNIKAFFEKRPDIKSMITAPDGHIYALPQYDAAKWGTTPDTLFINKDWLDQLGLEIPKTTEEFAVVLKAFDENDMNGNGKADEIPFSFKWDNAIRGVHSLSGSFGTIGRFIGVKDEKVYYAPIEPEYKEFVKYLQELYKEGVVDPEAFTHDVQVYDSKITSETPVLGAFFNWSNFASFGTTDTPYVAIPPLKGPKGDQMWNRNFETFSFSGFSITNANKNPVRAIKWADQIFDSEMSVQMNSGPLGVTLEKKDGKFVNLPTPKDMSYDEFRHKTTPGSYGAFAILEDMYEKIEINAGDEEKLGYAEMYEPFQPKEIYPNVLYTPEDADRLSILLTDLDGFINKSVPKFIIEGNVDKQWDAYIDKLNEMGMGELLEIYQKYYDSYLENR